MRKYKDDERIPFTDDIMFSLVMQDENICRQMLERILPNEEFGEIRINQYDDQLYVEGQKSIKFPLNSRGVRLDAFVKTRDAWAEIEMQTYSDEDIARRCRYYHANMDLDYLKEGEKYKKLPRTYVIFICTYDYMGTGDPIHTFLRYNPEKGLPLGDESYTIILNTACSKELVPPKLSALFEYINDPKKGIEDKLVDDIETQVAKFNTKEWRHRHMTLGELMDRNYEQGLEQGLEQGVTKKAVEVAKTMKENDEPLSKIAAYTGLTIEEIEKL